MLIDWYINFLFHVSLCMLLFVFVVVGLEQIRYFPLAKKLM
jgi:hypothetical protein